MKQMVFFSNFLNEHYVRQVMVGILDAPEFQAGWRLRVLAPPRTAREMERLLELLSPAAVVVFHLQAELVSMLLKRKIPCAVVDADIHPWADVPVVQIDHEAIGRCAADHLLDLRYRHFAVARSSGRALFIERQNGFVRRLGKQRKSCGLFLMPGREITFLRLHKIPPHLRKWLRDLPKPCAIFATNDEAGLRIVDACQQLGIRVPEELAVLGVDNTVLLCRMAPTPLSSVHLPFEEQGRRVAQLLCQWDPSRPPGRSVQKIPPSKVVSRASTTPLSPSDPVVAAAKRYMEQHISKPFHVRDLKALTGVSTSTLVAKFKSELGLTPVEAVRKARVDHAKQLLLETDLPITLVAKSSGFGSLERFCKVFREIGGQTPSRYRQSVRES